MPKNTHGTRSELIHCDNCGEDYNNSYKRCPFCGARADRSAYTQPTSRLDMAGRAGAGGAAGRRASGDGGGRPSSSQRPPAQDEDDYVFDGGGVFDDDNDEDDYRYSDRRGGKRLSGIGQISPTAIIGFLFSAAVITAAILIIVLVIVPMVRGGQTQTATNTPPASLSPPVTTSPEPSLPASPSPSPSDPGPDASDPQPTGEPSPSPTGSPSVSGGSLTLTYGGKAKDSFTISDDYPAPVQLRAPGAAGTVTWTTSNSAVATVDATGKVTRVGAGKCRITATDSEGRTGSCSVTCYGSGGTTAPSPSPSPSASPSNPPAASDPPASGSLTITAFGNPKTDITISGSGNNASPVQLRTSGASGDVTWTSSNPAVATVDANGKVTRVGAGRCTVTATDAGGQSASCIVRCPG